MPLRLTRREFLRASVVGSLAVTVVTDSPQAARAAEPLAPLAQSGLIDVNVTLFHWPFRRLPLDETSRLVSRLRRYGVSRAWACSFEALMHKDVGAVNARLVEECRRHGRGQLVPFGTVNLQLPEWEEDMRRCHEQFRMPGLRLYPNYHGYTLDDPRFARLLDMAAERRLVLQLVVLMEDERTQHPLVRVPHVNVTPLITLLGTRPQLQVVLLNWFRAANAELLPKLARAGQVFFDIATAEGVGGVSNLLKQVPVERVLFGSHAPFFYFESAFLKLKESPLTDPELFAIQSGNARRLLLPAEHAEFTK